MLVLSVCSQPILPPHDMLSSVGTFLHVFFLSHIFPEKSFVGVFFCGYTRHVSLINFDTTGSLLVWPVLYRALEMLVLWHLIAWLYGILSLCLLYWHQSLHTLLVPSCCLSQAYGLSLVFVCML